MTRVLMMVGCALMLSGAAMGASETWSNAPMIDTGCALKVKDSPDAHTKACALQCSKTGFGIVAADGSYLKFDESGNAKAVEALKASKAADHLRVTVTGDRQGDTIKVATLRLQ